LTDEPGPALDEAAIGEAYAALFEGLDQLGPGSSATRLALLERLRPLLPAAPAIADMGAGAGAGSLDLARTLPAARIIAIDRHQGFLDRLAARSSRADAEITVSNADMAAPGLAPASLDLVWCESAIYAIGRTAALDAWRPLLAPGGLVAFSDVVWTQPHPPAAAAAFWAEEYPAMTTVEGVRAEIAAAGYRLRFTRRAPGTDWLAYYAPLRPRVASLEPTATGALAIVLAGMAREIAILDAYGDSYAAVWFVVAPAADA